MCCKIGLLLYCIVQFAAFLFILVGTPIDMFRPKGEDRIGNGPCLTMWGFKLECYSTTYNLRTSTLWSACPPRLDRFRAAEAFAIISIAVYGLAFLLGLIQLCCCACFRWLCLVLNVVGIMTGCIVWALMADSYHSRRGPISVPNCAKLSTGFNYGSGFALYIVGWALGIIDIVFLMLPC